MPRSGKYRHRFELLRPKLGSDGEPERNSHGEETGELETVQSPWCDIITSNNSEHTSTAVNGQTQIGLETRFSRMYENAANNMFIRFRGDIYDITSADDPSFTGKIINILAIKRR